MSKGPQALIKFFVILFFSILPFVSIAASVEGLRVYKKNLHLNPVHKQKLADDISRYDEAEDLWDVLREEFSMPHYEDNPIVQDKIDWYLDNQDYLLRAATRASPYLYYVFQQIKKRHLPAELVLLPIIESGYNPFSYSSVGAAGIWQLMPTTATNFGVRQDWWYDGRRDVVTSTNAALNYLAYLQSFFQGNMLLAMAAYNTGEGNVLAAINRNIRNGRRTDFWSLPVAQQTRDYVPSLLALAVIISNPKEYPINFPHVKNAPYLAQVDVGQPMNLKMVAALAGISYPKMMQLNPGYNRTNISSKGPHKLILPITNVEQFTENLGRTTVNRDSKWIHYKVKSGDTFTSLARKFNVTIDSIRKTNRLTKNPMRPGTNLLIANNNTGLKDHDALDELVAARPSYANLINKIKKTATAFKAPTPKYVMRPGDSLYMVRRGDTSESIAQRFHIPTAELKNANRITASNLPIGRQLIIPTHIIAKAKPIPVKLGDSIYMVRKGDTLAKIANKFHVSAQAIKLVNLANDDTLTPGDKLIIPTHVRS